MSCIVITGGPGSGKTTLIEHLRELGFRVIREAALEVIKVLNQEHGTQGQMTWRKEHPLEFQLLVARQQLATEEDSEKEDDNVVFLDRGVLDGAAYCEFFQVSPTKELEECFARARYDAVLLLETLSDFDRRAGSGRLSSREDSLRTRDLLEQTYRRFGCDPIPVPEMPVAERARFVLDRLGIESSPRRCGPHS